MQKPNQNEVVNCLIATLAQNVHSSPQAREAFNKFCELYSEQIQRICIKYCDILDAAEYGIEGEDVCQDLLLEIPNFAKKFDATKGNFLSWFSKIIWNEILTKIKECKASGSVPLDAEEKEPLLDKAEQDDFEDHERTSATNVVELRSIKQKSKKRRELWNKEQEKVNAALNTLRPVLKDILLETMRHDPHRFPTETGDRIVKTYLIKRKSISKLRARAKEYFEKAYGKSVNWDRLAELAKINDSC